MLETVVPYHPSFRIHAIIVNSHPFLAMKPKIQALLAEMNAGLIDREQAIKVALLSVLAAENLVLIGPPGTAKSMVSRRVAQHIQSADGDAGSYFEYLLTKFSTPEEIFGPLSISELKADRFRRNTEGYLPTAHIAFLDEIFKSSSSILNALLTILNERIFHNGNQPQHVPLRSLISASNELPSGQEELSALYDRFLMRIFVGPVREEHLHLLFHAPGVAHQPKLQLTAQDLQAVDAAAQQVRMPPEVGEAIRGIWAAHKEAFKEDRREHLTDRRLVKLLKLLRVSAATNQRTEVDLSDVMLLQHCLWNHPDNMDKVREIVITTLQKHSSMVPVDDAGTTLDVYVVSGDGKQLVQQPRQIQKTATAASQMAVVSSSRQLAASGNALVVSPVRALPPTKTRTKGFMGSGTAQDPLRITNADDLISLDDPDIGLAGYHFVQTNDIDCATISHWPLFAFKGHYDGNGKTIRKSNATAIVRASGRFSIEFIFAVLHATSSVTDLRLEGFLLAALAVGTRIERCRVESANLLGATSDNTQLIDCQVTGGCLVAGEVKNTKITSCEVTGGGLIGGSAESTQITGCQVTGGGLVREISNSQITRCQVMDGLPLVWSSAFKSQISDSAVMVKYKGDGDRDVGLIAGALDKNSVVERCFVAGNYSATQKAVLFGGIAGACNSSIIRQCAVGSLKIRCSDLQSSRRIVSYSELNKGRFGSSPSLSQSVTLQNNASIDTNPGQDDPNGQDGKTVAAARFNQRFFEGSLGWDFDTVWQWDAANNRPTLRFEANAFQATDPAANNTTSANGTPLQDLLTRQVQANIWL